MISPESSTFGIVLVLCRRNSKEKEKAIARGRMIPIDKILSDSKYPLKYETWANFNSGTTTDLSNGAPAIRNKLIKIRPII